MRLIHSTPVPKGSWAPHNAKCIYSISWVLMYYILILLKSPKSKVSSETWGSRSATSPSKIKKNKIAYERAQSKHYHSKKHSRITNEDWTKQDHNPTGQTLNLVAPNLLSEVCCDFQWVWIALPIWLYCLHATHMASLGLVPLSAIFGCHSSETLILSYISWPLRHFFEIWVEAPMVLKCIFLAY